MHRAHGLALKPILRGEPDFAAGPNIHRVEPVILHHRGLEKGKQFLVRPYDLPSVGEQIAALHGHPQLIREETFLDRKKDFAVVGDMDGVQAHIR